MANFFQDSKNKIQDLFIYIVSCGKSSNEPSINDQGPARDVPLGDDMGLIIINTPEEDQDGAATNSKEPSRNNVQGQGLIVVIQAGNNTQNQEEDNIIAQQQGQGLDESTRNSQEQEEKNNDDFKPLPEGFIPEERSKFPQPPVKRSAPKPKTG